MERQSNGIEKPLNKEMFSLRSISDGCIKMAKVSLKTMRKQSDGIKKLLNKEILKLRPVSDGCIKMAKVSLKTMRKQSDGIKKLLNKEMLKLRPVSDGCIKWQGHPQNDLEAIKWYKRAAAQGDILAQDRLRIAKQR